MSNEPRYPYINFTTEGAPGGRVAVTVSVGGQIREQQHYATPRSGSLTGAAAIRDTFAEAASEAFNHPATQELIRAFQGGPVMVDCWGKRVKLSPTDP